MKRGLLSPELIKCMQEIAATMVIYKNALIENGISEKEALTMTIAYQGQQLEAAGKANIEEKKMMIHLNGVVSTKN